MGGYASVTVPVRGAGCVKSIIGYYPYEAKSYRPREGCGLRLEAMLSLFFCEPSYRPREGCGLRQQNCTTQRLKVGRFS